MRETFPKLFGKTKAGKIKEWEIEAVQNLDQTAYFVITHGQQFGKKTSTVQQIDVGKNLGKSNETTPFEQACSEAQSRWQKQIDSGYAISVSLIQEGESKELFLPMLAHRFDQHGHKMTWPAAMQPKFDGFRALARKQNGVVQLWSRKGKVLDVPKEILADLTIILAEGQALDGEIYKHDWRSDSGEPNFQRIASAIKKYGPDTPLLEYHVYDCPKTGVSFQERFLMAFWEETDLIKKVPTFLAKSEEEAMQYYQSCVTGEKPYEGAMVRSLEGLYQFDHRSYDLLKIKPLDDAEFQIIGGQEATGEDAGTVVFRCTAENGLEFNVRPTGSRDLRRHYWENLESYLGRLLTVQFNGRTNDGLPRFPRGVKIREEWD